MDGLMAGAVPQLHDEARGRTAHAEAIVAGGFPEARTRGTARQRSRYFESYVRGVVSRDLPDISDVLIESAGGDVAGVEVKAAASVDTADTRGLRFLRDKLGERFTAGVVVYSGAHTVALGDRLWAVPLAGLWT